MTDGRSRTVIFGTVLCDSSNWGRPTIVTYPDGKTEEFTYDALGRMVTSTDRCGTVTSYTYDNNGNITEKLLMNNGTEIKESYSYSLDNLLISYTDPCGNTTSYSYDKAGKLTKKNNPNGTSETYVYDGDVVASQNINGIITDFTYDVMGNVIAQTTAGRTTAYQYDPAGNVTIKINPDGGKTEYAYDKAGRLTAQTFGESVTQYVYDGNGNVTTEIMNTSPVSQTAYEYDAMNNLVTMNDNGIVTAYEYDNLGRCVKVTLSGGETSRFEYDCMGNMTAEQNANGQIILYSYDEEGRLLKRCDGVSDEKIASLTWGGARENDYAAAMTYTYDVFGNILTETNAENNENKYAYDNCGRVTEVTAPDGTVTAKYTYDGCGNLLTETDAKGNVTSYEYVNNMLSRKYDSLGTIKSYTYNDIGEVSSETDGEGNATSYEYDNCGRLVGVTMPEEVTTKYTYDKEGNMLSQTDGEGNQTTYAYYPFGMLQSVTNAEGEEESYEYDARGNMTAKTDGNGEVVNYTYDAKNNLISMSNGDILISYEYDALGNRTGMNDEHGNYTYIYDCGNRLTEILGRTRLSYEYDKTGNVTKCINSSVNPTLQISYEYDKCGRLISTNKNERRFFEEYTYDENGNLKRIVNNDGMLASYEYDARGRVTKIDTSGANMYSLPTQSYLPFVFVYEYDGNGNVTKKTDYFGDTNYTYDGAGRVKTVDNAYYERVYTYDKAGNRTALTERRKSLETETLGGNMIDYYIKNVYYLYSKTNRLQSAAESYELLENEEELRKVSRYVYDKAGNEISVTAEFLIPKGEEPTEEPSESEASRVNAVAKNYDSTVDITINSYDGLNRLANTTVISGGERTFTEYEYDGNGLRNLSRVNGKEKNYYYDRGNLVHVNSGDKWETYYYGAGGCTEYETDGQVYFCIKNAHGDVCAVVDNSGATKNLYNYDEFGNLIYSECETDNSIMYAGEYLDRETGNYYLKARYYSPNIGRFTQKDSYWNPQNMIYGEREEPEKSILPENKKRGEEQEQQASAEPKEEEPQIYTVDEIIKYELRKAGEPCDYIATDKAPERREEELSELLYPELSAVLQSTNLYVYCVNNPVMFVDPSGNESVLNDAMASIALMALVNKQYPWTIVSKANVAGTAVNARIAASITSVTSNKDTINAVADAYKVRADIMGSIIFKEQVTQSLPDIGVILDVKFNITDNPHSVGLAAITPTLARAAWASVNTDVYNALPTNDVDLIKKLTDPDFNVQTLAAALIYIAETKHNTPRDSILQLTDEQWRWILMDYNNENSYNDKVMEYVPYIKELLD